MWIGGAIHVRPRERRPYPAVMLDLYSRRVVALALGVANDTGLLLRGLTMAAAGRAPVAGPNFLWDRGSTYALKVVAHERKWLRFRANMITIRSPGGSTTGSLTSRAAAIGNVIVRAPASSEGRLRGGFKRVG